MFWRIYVVFCLLGLAGWAEPTTDILPKSDTAVSAYFFPGPGAGGMLPLKLNQKNPVPGSESDLSQSRVVFRRDGYLDRVVYFDPSYLDTGVPGNFENYERQSTFRIETEPRDAEVYEIGISNDRAAMGGGAALARLDNGSVVIDRLKYYLESTGTFKKEAKFRLTRDGYESLDFQGDPKQLVGDKNIGRFVLKPLPGFGNRKEQMAVLAKEHPGRLALFGLLVTGLALGTGFLLKRRRAAALKFQDYGTQIIDTKARLSVGKYRLLESIGQGGMAEVFKAYSLDDPERVPVALKLMHKGTHEQIDGNDRFRREIKASLALKHPSIAELFDWGEHIDGRLYLVSELLVGVTLKEVIRRQETSPPELARLVLQRVGSALAYLHELDMVHRDVKPDNVFVCEDGGMKLLDMGLILSNDFTVLTQTGNVLGTPAYMSPEQLNNQSVAASDQYSLGIMIYEILAGSRPFLQQEMAMLAYQHINVVPQSLRELDSRISVEVEAAVLKMLEKKPERRYPDLLTVQRELGRLLGALDWSAEGVEGTVNTALKPPPF